MAESKRALTSTVLLPVFVPAVAVTVLLVAGVIGSPELAGGLFSSTLEWITQTFGWFYMLAVAIFLVFMVAVGASSWGNIKLGPDHAEPQYNFVEWFAMLFSAGYGIALLFFGVAEPVLHFASPPAGAAETVDAAKQAMQIAFFHWGFHIWGIYGLVGLVLAYFSFRHGLPLSIRSALYPLIGDKIYGPIGHAVDVFAILGTLFGIATTLGLSVVQINAGINYLWPQIPVDITVQIIAIALITAAATLSVVAGMDKGVKRLSIMNMVLAIALMTFVFMVGPTIHILESFLQNTGSYMNGIVARTFNLQAYTLSDWIGNWTLFIFGWTIAWAPFVGMFIAKISRGRTIRQFVFGVMLVPSVFTFLWFSIFGDTALNLIMNEGLTTLIGDVQNDQAVALFKLLDALPGSFFISVLTVFLIITFFVTSSDSGSLVIDALASGGATNTPVWQRVFWAVLEGVLAAALLFGGGLKALQAMTVASALPFAIIMLVAMVGLWRALKIEGHRESSLQGLAMSSPQLNTAHWKQRLAAIVDFPGHAKVSHFIESTVVGSMRKVEAELQSRGWDASVRFDSEICRAHLQVNWEDHAEFSYDIRLTEHETPEFHDAELTQNPDAPASYYRAEVYMRRGGRAYDIFGYEENDIIKDILDQFEKYLHFLDISPGKLPWDMAEHDEMLNEVPEEAEPEKS
ncbi:BCCT family transporter [Marinobacter sp.]|uniref:BCCT family transporter n=1 Tax=Marinobacter sp. TaxID=50741 RepID=UPI001B7C6275|nr:BCCT family transporter [Marinobacter sp.]MBQ0833439.1 BCCT family transporter [Marinobacter sp.]